MPTGSLQMNILKPSHGAIDTLGKTTITQTIHSQKKNKQIALRHFTCIIKFEFQVGEGKFEQTRRSLTVEGNGVFIQVSLRC